jgi:PAS domain S-box-containing protein
VSGGSSASTVNHVDGVSRYSWFRSARSPGIVLVALIMFLGIGGYVLTSTTIRHDRDDAAERRARVEAVHAQEVLGRARAYVAGLADVLARERAPGQERFARWASGTSASVGLNDVLWVERVPASERRAYERRHGVTIVRLDRSGRAHRAPRAPVYLPATYTSQTRPELRPAVDVSSFPGLGAAIRDRARIFAAGASRPGSMGGEPGFYLLETASFAHGAARRGYLVAFVPRGWFSTTLGGDPRRVAISEDGRQIEGQLDSVQSSAGFEMLGRNWRVDVAREPPSGLQSLLPWLALAWPFAAAGIALVVGRAIALRRRAQQEVERIFELSPDLIAVADFQGHFTRVNPAVERILGYTEEEFLVHPDDRERTAREAAAVGDGERTLSFQNRYLAKDGSYRVLEWTSTPMVDDGLMYGVARDITERRLAEAEVARLANEQAVLRRVATLVAEAVPLPELFAAVTREAGALLVADYAGLAQIEDGNVRVVGAWAADGEHPPVPEAWPMQAGDPATTIAQTMEPSRWDDWEGVPGPIAQFIREMGIQSSVGCPIVVQGELWGALAVHTKRDTPLPADSEQRITQFNDLVAMALTNARARGEVARLADEQAALRRVATLVARDAPPTDVFAAVADAVAELFGTEDISMARYEGGRTRLIVASSGRFRDAFPVGSRQVLGGDNVGSRIFETQRAVRIDDYSTATGPIADAGRPLGIRCVIGTPIVVEDRLWGAITIGTAADTRLPPDTEARLGQFTKLLATAIANTESRSRAERLSDEQAALRRVATLVAEGVQPADLFAAVTRELARLFADWDPSLVPSVVRFDPGPEFVLVGAARTELEREIGSRYGPTDLFVSTRVLRTGASARVNEAEVDAVGGPDAELLRREGFLNQVGSPIFVEGRPWGAVTVNSATALPPDAGERLEKFTGLIATGVANAESREALAQLAAEQAALRRVATVVAREASQDEVFAAVSDEVRLLFALDLIRMVRFEGGETAFVVAGSGAREDMVPVGLRLPLGGENAATRVFRTGRPARIDDYSTASGPIADEMRSSGLESVVAAPIVVVGRRWGAMVVGTVSGVLPADTESRLGQFTDLMATAVANAEARAREGRLTEEQAALRRVATLVAEGASSGDVLDAVVGEMEALLDADQVALNRFEPGNEMLVLAHRGLDVDRTPVGSRMSIDGRSATADVKRTGLPARIEGYRDAEGPLAELARNTGLRSSVSAPITVEGRLWGVMTASWKGEEPPPPDTEERMVQFAGLLDTAIANADSRDQLMASRARLVTEADEARRRVVRDLHDGAQQRLVHTIVTLKLAQRAFGESRDEEDGRAEKLVGEALEHAEHGNAELRELAHGILPAVLTRGGLRSGIQAFVARLDLPVGVHVADERLPSEIEATAYFIVSEALTNVIKHSRASRAEVSASVENGRLRVEVRDDGIGGADLHGHGLVGIGDRAAALGGRLEVDSPPGRGTVVSATFPVAQRAMAADGGNGAPPAG